LLAAAVAALALLLADEPPEPPELLVAVMVWGMYSHSSRLAVSCDFLFSPLWVSFLKMTFSMPWAAVSSLTMGMGCGTF